MRTSRGIVGAALLALTLAGCGGTPKIVATPSSQETTPTPAVCVSSPELCTPDEATPEPETSTEDTRPIGKIGDSMDISEDGVKVATITLTKVVKTTRPESSFGEKPKYGRFLIVTIQVKALKQFEINPFDFYATDAEGTHYEYANGNALFAVDETLDVADLSPGEKLKGRIVFDVPKQALSVVYAPGIGSVGMWSVPK